MNIKTIIQDEILFNGRIPAFFKTLNNKGIYTVEDFINSDVEQMSANSDRRKDYRAYQRVLKYKYLGEPLYCDVLLNKEYSVSRIYDGYNRYKELENDIATLLGEKSYHPEWLPEFYKEKEQVKMIEILPYIKHHSSLIDFYVNYYQNRLNNEGIEETEVIKDKSSLDLLKRELVSLLNKRSELDTKISLLTEQINTLEGGKNVNGK